LAFHWERREHKRHFSVERHFGLRSSCFSRGAVQTSIRRVPPSSPPPYEHLLLTHCRRGRGKSPKHEAAIGVAPMPGETREKRRESFRKAAAFREEQYLTLYSALACNPHLEQLLPYSIRFVFKFGASGLSVMNSFESSRFLVTLTGALSSSLPLPHDISFTIGLSHDNHISYRGLIRVFHYSHRAHCFSKPIKRRSHAVCRTQLPQFHAGCSYPLRKTLPNISTPTLSPLTSLLASFSAFGGIATFCPSTPHPHAFSQNFASASPLRSSQLLNTPVSISRNVLPTSPAILIRIKSSKPAMSAYRSA
jgi:hypothetical protein